MREWKEVRFLKVLEDEFLSYGIVQPGPNVEENAVPMIRVQNITDGRIDKNGLKLVSKEIEKKYSRTRLKGGELLITVVGNVGECAIVPEDLKGCNVARAISVAKISDAFDKDFIRYSFLTDEIKFQIYGYTNDTVQPTLNLKELKKLKFLIPPIDQQQAIASILKSLDDKIDLLYRQNQTLEALAETLFRQWFVEDAGEDWQKEPLSEIANFLNGKACQKYPPKNEINRLPVLKIKELRNGVTESSDWASTDIEDEYVVENGDVIFSWSASLMVKIWDGPKCILNQHLFKVTSQDFPKWFYFSWCKYHLERFIAIAKAQATTMGHIRRKDLDKAMVAIPPDEVLERMTERISPFIDKVIANNQQVNKLEKLRDTLLPKLISGEIQVSFEEQEKQAVSVQSVSKRKRNIQFEEAILISAIVRAFYTPKIGNVSRQWYQKISYLHKRQLQDNQANIFELTKEYGKKAAGPYKKEMRYQGPEGIAVSNGYIEPVGKKAFKPADQIEDIDKYFYDRDYWDCEVFESWTVPTLKFVPVKKLGVWATVDYCLIELKENSEKLNARNVLDYMGKSKEWKHKLKLSEFSPENIELRIEELFEMYNY